MCVILRLGFTSEAPTCAKMRQRVRWGHNALPSDFIPPREGRRAARGDDAAQQRLDALGGDSLGLQRVAKLERGGLAARLGLGEGGKGQGAHYLRPGSVGTKKRRGQGGHDHCTSLGRTRRRWETDLIGQPHL